MALTGNIADWSLADLLQIIAAERKSGTLTLRREDEEVHLDFSGGLLVNASERRLGHEHAARRGRSGRLLGRQGAAALGHEIPGGFLAFLVSSGRVRPDQARAVILLAHETGGDTVSAVLKAELMTQETLEEAMTAYAQDLFTRVLTWESGDYTFAADPKALKGRTAKSGAARSEAGPSAPRPGQAATGTSPARAVALNTDGLLLEGMRRIDEQPRIGEIVQPETIFARVEAALAPPDLGRSEAAILDLIDGRRDVRALAPAAQLGEYEAAEALFNLHHAGLIKARAGEPLAHPETVRRAAAERPPAAFLRAIALALVLAASLAYRLVVYGPVLPGRAAAPSTESLSAREEAALRFAQALFLAHTGREATSPEELVRAGLLPGGFGRWEGVTLSPSLRDPGGAEPPP